MCIFFYIEHITATVVIQISEFFFLVVFTYLLMSFDQPCEIGCYSRVEGGEVYFDDRSLVSIFFNLVSFCSPVDLGNVFVYEI